MDREDDDDDDIVEIVDSASSGEDHPAAPAPTGSLLHVDAALQSDASLRALRSEEAAAKSLVASRSLALSAARAELHRASTRLAARAAELAAAAEKRADWGGGERPFDAAVDAALRGTFGLRGFRPLQREAVNALLSGRDVLGVLPTGGGKSLIYQLAAVVKGGVSVVVSPLLALMHEQMVTMRRLGIRAYSLDSGTTKEEAAEVWKECLPAATGKVGEGAVLVFVTPERVAKSKKLMNRLQVAFDRKPSALSLIVIDEVHSISTLGHEYFSGGHSLRFRTDYSNLGSLRRAFPTVPICGLTATATDEVTKDVVSSLGIRPVIFRGCMDRSNLQYEVRPKASNDTDVIKDIAELIKAEFQDQTGIIYVLSRKDAELVSNALRVDHSIRAGCFHADMPLQQRQLSYSKWSDGSLSVLVGTIAFGLGIDQQSCRYVIHKELSTSLHGYVQESGRAGRDGRPAKCVLFYRPADVIRLCSFVADKGANRVSMVLEIAKYASGRSDLLAQRVGLENGSVVTGKHFRRDTEQLSCRRAILAAAFGETPAPRVDDTRSSKLSEGEIADLSDRGYGKAAACCDLCASSGKNSDLVPVNVTEEAVAIVNAVQFFHGKYPDENLTVNALCEGMGNTGPKGKKLRGGKPALPRVFDKDVLMEICVTALHHQVLELYHTYGMYSMLSYVSARSARSSALLSGNTEIIVSVPAKHGVVSYSRARTAPAGVESSKKRRKGAGAVNIK